ncbi:MAG: Histidine biosynthesis bifunctional protein hisB [Gomphillus americanus]|uniref:1-(5-phosphoribosyl)-5-[(5-phosphoribosylamino)methylideneamino] imidazole-4-carboxamide isomerase n=1 Tax=Gomphillus americanus TaxID=1940652 RepID=A0A8H3FSQ1_9LECA|nr:MAG: Histidine biosynthesis bifunctional protein hisB [Gomphillus americanus]
MTIFRPCIDLHEGQVKQIVGGTLTDNRESTSLRTNHISKHSAGHFASLYQTHNLRGGHVIMLGPGNEFAATQALQTWPGALQIGGGINDSNAAEWLAKGAEKIIITSYLFANAQFSLDRLEQVLSAVDNNRHKLVIDLSCRRQQQQQGPQDPSQWIVAMNKWQTLTDMVVDADSIRLLEPYCSEFLIHAADNEGLQGGIDEQLVQRLSEWCSIPVTYAGGARSLEDLELVRRLSNGRVDLTIGSALDVFGGDGVRFSDVVAWNQTQGGDEVVKP